MKAKRPDDARPDIEGITLPDIDENEAAYIDEEKVADFDAGGEFEVDIDEDRVVDDPLDVAETTSGTYHFEVGESRHIADFIPAESKKTGARGRVPCVSGEGRSPRRTMRIALLIALLIALGTLVVAGGAIQSFFEEFSAAIGIGEDSSKTLDDVLVEPKSNIEPYYVLLIGSDARAGKAIARSDTLMLVRVDPTNRQVTLISIPRDTRVKLEGHGSCKISAAYAYDGAMGAVEAVSEFAGVSIAHCFEVDFSGFEAVVDELGGIEIDVPYDTEYNDVTIEAGLQTLSGKQALLFCRCRNYASGDFQRTANQRMFVEALLNRILATDAAELPSLVENLSECVTTDMSASELASLAASFKGAESVPIYSAVVPATTENVDGIPYAIPDDDAWQAMMERVDEGLSPDEDNDASSETKTE